jgi:large subunit ribosomal protein L13
MTDTIEENTWMNEKTFVAKPKEIDRRWFVVDAEGKTLGRLASQIAVILKGKHKPIYTPSVDCGDYVVVVNAEKVAVTGRRLDQKKYYRHSGYMGGLKEVTLRDQLERYPERVLFAAVKGMLPKNTLGRQMLRKLKVYAGPKHPHQAQQPEPMEL